MKVKDIIKAMGEYDPEEELIIDWWDKQCFDFMWNDNIEHPLDDTERRRLWNEMASSFVPSDFSTDTTWEDIWYSLEGAREKYPDKVA